MASVVPSGLRVDGGRIFVEKEIMVRKWRVLWNGSREYAYYIVYESDGLERMGAVFCVSISYQEKRDKSMG